MVKWQPIIYLTAGEVITFNQEILRRAGASRQIATFLRERGLLESAVQRPQNVAYYSDADLIIQAALYMVGIALNHPFVDGNKRTGYISGMTFLQVNGFLAHLNPELTLRTGRSPTDSRDRRGTRIGRRNPRVPEPLYAKGLPDPVRLSTADGRGMV